MFAALPSGFDKLSQAVETLGKFTLAAPPPLDDLAVRLRKSYANARVDGYKGLSIGAIRRLPYALWIEGQPPLHVIEPDLVNAYWSQYLPDAVSKPRSAKRWLSPLFYIYCHAFHRGRADFQDFAQRLRSALLIAQGPFALWLSSLQSNHRWFVPDEVGMSLGEKLATDAAPLTTTIASFNLWPGFLGCSMASEAFAGALRLPNDVLSRESVTQRIKSWSRVDDVSRRDLSMFRYQEHRALLADGLIRPWLKNVPPDSVRNAHSSFLIKHYGDPRMLNAVHQGHHWQGVSEQTVSTVKRWLVGDTLRGFMRILQLTADDIWRYRERFWMAYYDHGVIDEAWIALGSQAHFHVRRELQRLDLAPYGQLTSGASPNQSVLFLRIGDLQFMEWSHNGSLRASRVGDIDCPPMYLKHYNGHELRLVNSMDFHDGRNQQHQLTHMGSDRGAWQRRARDFINKHTGVRLNDQAIIG